MNVLVLDTEMNINLLEFQAVSNYKVLTEDIGPYINMSNNME